MTVNELNLAGKGHRILNLIIDIGACFLIWFIISVILMAVGFNQSWTDETGEELPIIPMIIFIPVYWGYYIVTEYFFQKTLGKLLTRTKVVTIINGNPSLKHIIIRTISRSIPFEYFSYLVTVTGIHDILSKTRVVLI